jgi:glycosyltransferase involved in cell wall biosynthesis
MQIFYLAEIDLPNTSAYTIHVLKMCDALAKNYKVTLVVFSKIKISFFKIKKDYVLDNHFKIVYYSSNQKKKNFFFRIKFALFCNKLIHRNDLVISRSVMASLYLAYRNKFNYLEIHHKLYGITKTIFFFKDYFLKKLFFILIHKNLKKVLSIKKKYLILNDAVNVNNFKRKIKIKYHFSYLGGLYQGKGAEIMIYLAKQFPKYNFNIFSDLNTADIKIINLIKMNNLNNLKLHNHAKYSSAIKIINSSQYLLMPYLERVMVRSKNLEVSNFMSPLKMFDYLASGNILIASNLKVYKHILKNNYNCILASPNNFSDWKEKIQLILNKKIDIVNLRKNALRTANKYTWNKRVDLILNNYLRRIKS